MSNRFWKRKGLPVYGVDTETYAEPSYGLKSVQVACPDGSTRYLTTSDWSQSDWDIRMEITDRFIDLIEEVGVQHSCIFAFFNLKFDFSQVALGLLKHYEYETERNARRSGIIKILETDMNIYKVTIKVGRHTVQFIDISNFLTGGATLDQACADWLGRHKVVVESKRFVKEPATDLEIEYALEDARLTRDLFNKLDEEGVVEEDRFVTIASRTMNHFTDFCRSNGWKFEDMFFHTSDKDEIAKMNEEFERIIRPSTRGGIVQAVHVGDFRGCTHVDAHSMYPTQMHREYTPCGGLLDAEPRGPHTYLVAPTGWFRLKPKHVGCVQWKSHMQCNMYSWLKVYEPSEYVQDFYLDGSYWIWEDEWEIIKQQYELIRVDDSRRKYIKYQRNTILRKYIELLYEGKRTSTGTRRYYYKILLNALYGKFMSRPDGVRIIYEETENGYKRTKVKEDDRKTYYLPMGSWVAMMGRVSLMKVIMTIPYDNVLYCDTDSVIYIGSGTGDIPIGDGLGDWGIEGEDLEVHPVGPKTYQERYPNGRVITKCAGLGRESAKNIEYGDLAEGKVYTSLKSKRDPETLAINLYETEFTVSCKPNAWRNMA